MSLLATPVRTGKAASMRLNTGAQPLQMLAHQRQARHGRQIIGELFDGEGAHGGSGYRGGCLITAQQRFKPILRLPRSLQTRWENPPAPGFLGTERAD